MAPRAATAKEPLTVLAAPVKVAGPLGLGMPLYVPLVRCVREQGGTETYAEAPVPVGLVEGAATPDGYGALAWTGELLEAGTAGAPDALTGELLEAGTAGADAGDEMADTVTVE